MSSKHKIVIVGAGGIGRAAALILVDAEALDADIFIGDVNTETAKETADWVTDSVSWKSRVTPFTMPYEGANEEMIQVFKDCEVVLDCLPGSQAPRIAKMADQYDLHYANLTEYVKETNEVIEIAKNSKKGFVLQTGLAPGFINVLANSLFMEFCAEHKVEKVDSITMKVGALTTHAVAPHYYGFTWSPVGVATEYLKPCVAVRDFKKTTTLPALSDCQTIIIDGITYEDNFTSGGAADMPDALDGRVKDLDYKTLRYPGHYDWVQKILTETPADVDAVKYLQDTMQSNIPAVEDDVVIIYSSVTGKDSEGVLRSIEASYRIEPSVIGDRKLRAIQTTTAAPLCEIARMLLKNEWSGPIFQSQIDPQEFMNGPFVSSIYGAFRRKRMKSAVS